MKTPHHPADATPDPQARGGMSEDEFCEFCVSVAEFASAYDDQHGFGAGPAVSARWEPDEDGFSSIVIYLRWLERMPLSLLEPAEMLSEMKRRGLYEQEPQTSIPPRSHDDDELVYSSETVTPAQVASMDSLLSPLVLEGFSVELDESAAPSEESAAAEQQAVTRDEPTSTSAHGSLDVVLGEKDGWITHLSREAGKYQHLVIEQTLTSNPRCSNRVVVTERMLPALIEALTARTRTPNQPA